MEKKSNVKFFANYMMTPEEHGVWNFARSVSHQTQVFNASYRTTAASFEGLNFKRVARIQKRLIKKGWFVELAAPKRGVKGWWQPGEYRVLSAIEYQKKYPERCQTAIERVQKNLGMVAESKDFVVLGEAADAGSDGSKDKSTESKDRIDPSKDKTDAVQGQNEAQRGTKTAGSKDKVDGVEGQNRTSSCPTHGTYIEYYTALNTVTNTDSNMVINTEDYIEASVSPNEGKSFVVVDDHPEGLPRDIDVKTTVREDQQAHQQDRHHNHALVPRRTPLSSAPVLGKEQVAQHAPTAPVPPRSPVSLDGTASGTASVQPNTTSLSDLVAKSERLDALGARLAAIRPYRWPPDSPYDKAARSASLTEQLGVRVTAAKRVASQRKIVGFDAEATILGIAEEYLENAERFQLHDDGFSAPYFFSQLDKELGRKFGPVRPSRQTSRKTPMFDADKMELTH